MGVPDLRILGFALRLRWEWQKRATDAPAWMRLPSRPEKLVDAMFSYSVRIDLGDGASALFWTKSWLPAGKINSFALHLFRAVGKLYLNTTVKDAMF
jgi:hypothetical protein